MVLTNNRESASASGESLKIRSLVADRTVAVTVTAMEAIASGPFYRSDPRAGPRTCQPPATSASSGPLGLRMECGVSPGFDGTSVRRHPRRSVREGRPR